MSMEVHAKHITAKQAPFKTPDNCNGKFADLSFSILPGLRPSGLIAKNTEGTGVENGHTSWPLCLPLRIFHSQEHILSCSDSLLEANRHAPHHPQTE
jgi:hypothetical protein